jgi:hypothetical protein
MGTQGSTEGAQVTQENNGGIGNYNLWITFFHTCRLFGLRRAAVNLLFTLNSITSLKRR